MKHQINDAFTGKQIAEIEHNSWEEIDYFLKKAKKILDNNSFLPKGTRITILKNFLNQLEANKEEVINTAIKEGGKPLKDTVIEFNRAKNGVELAIQAISTQAGQQIPMGHNSASNNFLAFTQKEPIGIVVSISAFNHPINLIIHQLITTVAAGCPAIIKPAPETPLTCFLLFRLLKLSGIPEPYAKAVFCTNEIAEKMATDERVNYLSFIGSAKVGWALRSKLAWGTRIALEHGGVAPLIIDEDYDYTNDLDSILRGAFYHAGQVCVSVQKIYVHENDLTKFLTKIKEKTLQIKTGNPLKEETEVGPIIREKEISREDEWVQEAKKEGGEIICGGEKLENNCYSPTIILNPTENSKVSTEEIFGPVVCIYSYDKIDNAIKRANSLPFIFQASIFTKNIDLALKASKNIKAKAVMINQHTAFRVDWMPFGGDGHSGIGVGGIEHSINEMSREKLTVIKSIDT